MSNGKPTDLLWNLLGKIGIDNNKQSKYIVFLFIILSLYILIQSIFCIGTKWDEGSTRYLAMEDAEFGFYVFWLSLELFYKPENVLTMLHLIDSDYFNYEGVKLSNEKNNLIEDNEKRVLTIGRGYFLLLFCHIASNSVPPLLITLYRKTVTGYNGDLPLPYEYCLPYNLNDHIIVYALIYLVHIFFGHYAHLFCATVMVSCVLTVMDRLATDMKVLNISIREMDNYFSCIEQSENNSNLESNINQEYLKQLRHFQRQLIENHKLIIRNVEKANNAIGTSAIGGNQAVLMFGCMSLYRSVEAKNGTEKIIYAIVYMIICVMFFMYCFGGQKMQNEDEKLRTTLAEFNWINKPKWFQKSHLTMMITSNRTLEVKPYGLYTINYVNFTNVMKAGYTFCNALRTIHKN